MENENLKIKLRHFDNVSEFYVGICELSELKLQNVDAILSILRAKKQSKTLLDEYNEVRNKILLDECLKNENGEPLVDNNQYTFSSEEIAITVKNKIDELERKEIEFEVTPIDILTLGNTEGIKASLIENLRGFVKY
jgi:hypothetical protein